MWWRGGVLVLAVRRHILTQRGQKKEREREERGAVCVCVCVLGRGIDSRQLTDIRFVNRCVVHCAAMLDGDTDAAVVDHAILSVIIGAFCPCVRSPCVRSATACWSVDAPVSARIGAQCAVQQWCLAQPLPL